MSLLWHCKVVTPCAELCGGCVISRCFLSLRELEKLRKAHSEARSVSARIVLQSRFLCAMRTSHLHFVVFSVACTSAIFCKELPENMNSTVSYDPEALLSKIFNFNGTIESRATNGFNFDDGNNDFVIFDSNVESLQQSNNDQFNPIVDNVQKLPFGHDNRVGKVEKKRRRRKPRVQGPQGFTSGYYGLYAPYVPTPGIGSSPFYGQGPQSIYGPSKPQRPSLASEALSSVSEALTSIALFDDRQCVARLLCEAASGAPGSATLQSIAGLQPLLTLLSTYQGISSNPLFVFGRAAFLGMSSKSNPASCRYAYPLCPTDPEQLVFYLNNHNGGFFRFFNGPQRGQQNVNQFFNQLSQNNGNQQSPFPHNNGYNNPDQYYQSNQLDDFEIQKYGTKYPYDQNKYSHLNKIRFKSNDGFENKNKIEKRIQNRPSKYLDDFEDNFSFENVHDYSAKWSFPGENNIRPNKIRVGKGIKFPESSFIQYDDKEVQNKRDPRGFIFPDTRVEYSNFNKYQESDFKDNNYNYNLHNFNADIYKGYSSKYNENDNDQSVQTIYVVRGNGDPNHPEIIKLRPGQTIY